MSQEACGDVTQLLVEWSRGDSHALEQLVPLVYGELRRMASRRLRSERRDHTLETSGLVHETYLRLVDQRSTDWRNRAHFFAIAARMMRRVLVDYERRRRYQKRGGGLRFLSFEEIPEVGISDSPDILALDEALDHLSAIDPQRSEIVELRFFGGMTHEEIAEVLGVSAPTVARGWRVARAFLYRDVQLGRSR